LPADGLLAVLPNLRAPVRPAGRVVLTRKFISGMQAYATLWSGPVVAIMEPSAAPSENLDNVEVEIAKLPFGVEVVRYDSPALREHLRRASVILGGVSSQQNHLPDVGRAFGVPVVFGAEYSLLTRIQIVRAETKSQVRQLRRIAWEWSQERAQRLAITRAQGLQCNGTPTWNAYRALSPNPLLYFDTRTGEDLVSSDEVLERRLAELRRGGRLRLAFTGRLNRMKGADHLPLVARELVRLGSDFEFVICGGGPLEAELAAAIARLGLTDRVVLRGVLDFKTELVPYVSRSVDLFVCCHRQGDPSCTYLETFACGVPIAGYANEAFAGLLELAPVGVSSKLDRPLELARAIHALERDRDRLAALSRSALAFARDHTFEVEFRRRIAHLREVSERESGRD